MKISLLTSFLLFLALSFTNPLCAQNELTQQSDKGSRFLDLDVKPTFNGGNLMDFRSWIYDRINLPEKLSKKLSNRTDFFFFGLDEQGKIINLRTESKEDKLVKQVMQIIESAPLWKPGEKNGVMVKVIDMSVPINYYFVKKQQQEKQ